MSRQNNHYIGGQWRVGDGNETIEVTNPATEDTVGSITSATTDEVAEALRGAQDATYDWSHRPAAERGALLRQMSEVVANNVDELSNILVEEQGKTKGIAEFEVGASAEYIRYMADWDRRIEGEILPSDDAGESIHLERKPYGVVSAIIPWNFPLFVLFRKLIPALVTGNTVVAKPSEETPLATLRMWELVEEQVDFPDNVVNIVNGGGEVGEQLVTSKNTDLVSMTGHRDTGKAIAKAAAENLTETALELGGKAPAVVLKDADIDKAVQRIVKASSAYTGQLCTSVERVYVHSDVKEEFEEKYAEAAANLTMDDPASDPDLGPQINENELRKTEDAIEKAREEGGRVLTGGKRPEQFSAGYWYEPTVVTDVEQGSILTQKEVFGPVTPITEVSSFEEAIEFSNDTEYGLAAYIYTSDYSKAMKAAHDIDFGEVYINRTLGEALQGFHAGWNESGNGGEDGKHGVLKYTRLKTIYHNYGDGEPGW